MVDKDIRYELSFVAIVFVFAFIVIGCSALKQRFEDNPKEFIIEAGLTTAEVIKILGPPILKSFLYAYRNMDEGRNMYFLHYPQKLILFEDNKVVNVFDLKQQRVPEKGKTP